MAINTIIDVPFSEQTMTITWYETTKTQYITLGDSFKVTPEMAVRIVRVAEAIAIERMASGLILLVSRTDYEATFYDTAVLPCDVRKAWKMIDTAHAEYIPD